MYMIKSNGGSGTVTGLSFNNFMGHSNAYTLDFDTAWSSMDVADGDGISYSNISFSGWSGSCEDGTERGPVKINCPAEVVCTDISVEDFSVWTDSGDSVLYGCQNAYGTGACLQSGDSGSDYTTTQTVATGTASYQTMDNELSTGFDISSSIPIPSMPASFYPGRQPISALLSGSAATATAAATASASGSSGDSAAASPAGYAASGSGSGSTLATTYTSAAATATTTAAAKPTSGSEGWGMGSGFGGWGKGSWGKGSAKLRRRN